MPSTSWPSVPDDSKLQACAESKIMREILGCSAPLTFTFRIFTSTLFLFLALQMSFVLLFSFPGHLLWFILGVKLRLDEC